MQLRVVPQGGTLPKICVFKNSCLEYSLEVRNMAQMGMCIESKSGYFLRARHCPECASCTRVHDGLVRGTTT